MARPHLVIRGPSITRTPLRTQAATFRELWSSILGHPGDDCVQGQPVGREKYKSAGSQVGTSSRRTQPLASSCFQVHWPAADRGSSTPSDKFSILRLRSTSGRFDSIPPTSWQSDTLISASVNSRAAYTIPFPARPVHWVTASTLNVDFILRIRIRPFGRNAEKRSLDDGAQSVPYPRFVLWRCPDLVVGSNSHTLFLWS